MIRLFLFQIRIEKTVRLQLLDEWDPKWHSYEQNIISLSQTHHPPPRKSSKSDHQKTAKSFDNQME